MTGRPATFMLAAVLVIVWAITGPFFHYSDTWQLVINTSTTIVTFLMVFLIQNTQNRDTAAMQIKLDELIRAMEGAHNALLDLEELEEKDLSRFRKHYEKLAEEARAALDAGGSDTDSPFVERDTGRTGK
jgi:low affinity Fe/Cu permease